MAREISNVGQWVIGAIKRGTGPTQALREFRAAGGAMRTQTWFRSFGEVTRALGERETLARVPLGRRPTSGEVTPYTSARRSGYLYVVDVLTRDRASGLVYRTQSGFRSDRLVPFASAVQGAIDNLAGTETELRLVVIGGFPIEVREFVPEEG